jgi:hypothetical protein
MKMRSLVIFHLKRVTIVDLPIRFVQIFRVLFQRDTTSHTRIILSEFLYEKTTTHIHTVILNINVSMSRQNMFFLCKMCNLVLFKSNLIKFLL